jgi:hypothetical protein
MRQTRRASACKSWPPPFSKRWSGSNLRVSPGQVSLSWGQVRVEGGGMVARQRHPTHSLGQLLQPQFRKRGRHQRVSRACGKALTSSLRNRLMRNIDWNRRNAVQQRLLSVRAADTVWYFNMNTAVSSYSTTATAVITAILLLLKAKTKLRGLSQQTNYTGRATALCRRS